MTNDPKDIKGFCSCCEDLRGMGLISFHPRSEFFATGIDEGMMEEAAEGDEVLIVGRTLRWLVEHRKDILLQGLRRGVNLKLLFLDLQKVCDGSVDFRVIGLNEPKPVEDDLKIALKHIDDMVQQSEQKKYRGSFECKVYDFVVDNSFVVLTQSAKGIRKLILDFSFGGEIEDKFHQYYECDPYDDDQFVNRLYRFYQDIYDDCAYYKIHTTEAAQKNV